MGLVICWANYLSSNLAETRTLQYAQRKAEGGLATFGLACNDTFRVLYVNLRLRSRT
jgi:hypothetical protein